MERELYARYFEIEDRHWWFVGRREIFLSLLSSGLDGRRSLELLDFGCGTGTMLGHLSRFGHVRGVDADEEAVAFCRQRGIEDVQRLEDRTLPFDEASFDVVTALDVLEHLDDDQAALSELHRVIRPGGILLVAVPAFGFLWGLQDEVAHHRRRYVAKELRERLLEAGFGVSRMSYFNTFMFPPIAALRLLRRLLPGQRRPQSDFEVGPRWLNGALARLFSVEARVISRRDLPFGVSLLAVAERPRPATGDQPGRPATSRSTRPSAGPRAERWR